MNSKDLADLVRLDVLKMVHDAHASHIGSALSIVDILSVLYCDILKYKPDMPQWENRDIFVLSKGHGGSALYAVLAECGFFPKEWLGTYDRNGSVLSGHVSHKGVPGVEVSTGSLGHGACIACGMALAYKLDHKANRVFSIVGDGECDEGSIWEMAMFANHFRLSDFTLIIDHNRLQSFGPCEDTIELLDLGKKFHDFGWHVSEVDGHDHGELRKILSSSFSDDKPHCVIANTIKGKGISFMENNVLWHYRDPQGNEYEQALRELGEKK